MGVFHFLSNRNYSLEINTFCDKIFVMDTINTYSSEYTQTYLVLKKGNENLSELKIFIIIASTIILIGLLLIIALLVNCHFIMNEENLRTSHRAADIESASFIELKKIPPEPSPVVEKDKVQNLPKRTKSDVGKRKCTKRHSKVKKDLKRHKSMVNKPHKRTKGKGKPVRCKNNTKTSKAAILHEEKKDRNNNNNNNTNNTCNQNDTNCNKQLNSEDDEEDGSDTENESQDNDNENDQNGNELEEEQVVDSEDEDDGGGNEGNGDNNSNNSIEDCSFDHEEDEYSHVVDGEGDSYTEASWYDEEDVDDEYEIDPIWMDE